MRIGLRVLFGYFVIVALAAVLLLQVFVQQIKPGVRQAMEDTLIDTANLLAELAADDLRAGHMADGRFAAAVTAYQQREVGAELYGFPKMRGEYRVMVTDAHGIVVFDSAGRDVGRDNSRWRDVALTLRGEYGARSSPETPDDPDNTVMHVAAPIRDGAQLIGVLTVAKPNRTVAPFIERSQQTVMRAGTALLVVALLVGIGVAWWIASQLSRLRRYADAVTRGERAQAPPAHGEFGALSQALATMREKLEGKQYVEQYVHTLTHELKSPLAAIRASSELLQSPMPEADRAGFIASIASQGERMADMIDKLLALAELEHRQTLQQPQPVGIAQCVGEAVTDVQHAAQAAGVQVQVAEIDPQLQVLGDGFLLRQSLRNLLDNAIAFAPAGSAVQVGVQVQAQQLCIEVADRGAGIPDYAQARVFERFYSTPRPHGGSRSSGLGLSFVAEAAHLHGGRAQLRNREGGGALAQLWLPLTSS